MRGGAAITGAARKHGAAGRMAGECQCCAQARLWYPDVPVITSGDMRSMESRRFWCTAAIRRRLDVEGIPLIFSGWPCDGDSPQSARAQISRTHRGDSMFEPGLYGLSHPATAILSEIWRIPREVRAYMNTPRKETLPFVAAAIRKAHRP